MLEERAPLLVRGLHCHQSNRRLWLCLLRVSSGDGRLLSVCGELNSSLHKLSVLTVVTLNPCVLKRLQPNEAAYPLPSPAEFILRVGGKEGIQVALINTFAKIGSDERASVVEL